MFFALCEWDNGKYSSQGIKHNEAKFGWERPVFGASKCLCFQNKYIDFGLEVSMSSKRRKITSIENPEGIFVIITAERPVICSVSNLAKLQNWLYMIWFMFHEMSNIHKSLFFIFIFLSFDSLVRRQVLNLETLH